MTDWLVLSINIAYAGLLVSILFAFIRLILGPTLADRVVALDLISFTTIGFVTVYTLDSGQQALLDIAITLGLVAFLGTVAFARLIIKQKGNE
ncbi:MULTISPECIES: cation:proton antiporter [Vibrio]|uniref:Cation:proton antiporter n=1 Tax=Vibrio ostreae TaxID=2841925 RepID=A0A975UB36_9VIBR|nr:MULTISPECIES: cation:proton antiporter [Vibrio]QXO18583.1 cation:proton antiporter [Vibrio ostreae]WGY47118.1 cation:proton antiporter [Vibrio sp. ABG19]